MHCAFAVLQIVPAAQSPSLAQLVRQALPALSQLNGKQGRFTVLPHVPSSSRNFIVVTAPEQELAQSVFALTAVARVTGRGVTPGWTGVSSAARTGFSDSRAAAMPSVSVSTNLILSILR